MHCPILMAATTNSAFNSAMIKQNTKTIKSSISTACAQLSRHLICCQACIHFEPMQIFHLKHTISGNDCAPILSYSSTCNVFNIGQACKAVSAFVRQLHERHAFDTLKSTTIRALNAELDGRKDSWIKYHWQHSVIVLFVPCKSKNKKFRTGNVHSGNF